MTTSTVSPKYQIVIPKEIRNALQLKPGQQVSLTLKEGHVEVAPILSADRLVGFLKSERPLEFQREPDRALGEKRADEPEEFTGPN